MLTHNLSLSSISWDNLARFFDSIYLFDHFYYNLLRASYSNMATTVTESGIPRQGEKPPSDSPNFGEMPDSVACCGWGLYNLLLLSGLLELIRHV